MSTANQIQHEVDILEVMRRLRNVLSDLDNCSFLAHKMESLGDPKLSDLVGEATSKVSESTESLNKVIKYIESNSTYKDLVRRYRNPPSPNNSNNDPEGFNL